MRQYTKLTNDPYIAKMIAVFYGYIYDKEADSLVYYTPTTDAIKEILLNKATAIPDMTGEEELCLQQSAHFQKRHALDIWARYEHAKTDIKLGSCSTDPFTSQGIDEFKSSIDAALKEGELVEQGTRDPLDRRYRSYRAGIAFVCRFYFDHSRHIPYDAEKQIRVTSWTGSIELMQGIFDTCIQFQANIAMTPRIEENPTRDLDYTEDLKRLILLRICHYSRERFSTKEYERYNPQELMQMGFVLANALLKEITEGQRLEWKGDNCQLSEHLYRMIKIDSVAHAACIQVFNDQITLQLKPNDARIPGLQDIAPQTITLAVTHSEHRELSDNLKRDKEPSIEYREDFHKFAGSLGDKLADFYKTQILNKYTHMFVPLFLVKIFSILFSPSMAIQAYMLATLSYWSGVDLTKLCNDNLFKRTDNPSTSYFNQIMAFATHFMENISAPHNLLIGALTLLISGGLFIQWLPHLTLRGIAIGATLWLTCFPHHPPSYFPYPIINHIAMLFTQIYGFYNISPLHLFAQTPSLVSALLKVIISPLKFIVSAILKCFLAPIVTLKFIGSALWSPWSLLIKPFLIKLLQLSCYICASILPLFGRPFFILNLTGWGINGVKALIGEKNNLFDPNFYARTGIKALYLFRISGKRYPEREVAAKQPDTAGGQGHDSPQPSAPPLDPWNQ